MNDVFRKEYTPVTEQNQMHIGSIKSSAERLLEDLNNAIDTTERSEASRCMAIAKTNLEQSIMWAVKGITSKENNENNA